MARKCNAKQEVLPAQKVPDERQAKGDDFRQRQVNAAQNRDREPGNDQTAQRQNEKCEKSSSRALGCAGEHPMGAQDKLHDAAGQVTDDRGRDIVHLGNVGQDE